MEGGCQCGSLRYRVRGQPLALFICHCRECRKQSASAFGISAQWRRKDFEILQGTPALWTRAADSGGQVRCHFCPSCGSRIWHESTADSEMVTVKGGSLDEPPDLSQAIHIWTSRKLPSVTIPADARCFPGEPE